MKPGIPATRKVERGAATPLTAGGRSSVATNSTPIDQLTGFWNSSVERRSYVARSPAVFASKAGLSIVLA